MTSDEKVTNPMQPFVKENDVVRFKSNMIVRWILDQARAGKKCDLNDIAVMNFTQDDRIQFAQLIGYSLCGFHELSYVTDSMAKQATKEAQKLFPECGGCRDKGCPIHSDEFQQD